MKKEHQLSFYSNYPEFLNKLNDLYNGDCLKQKFMDPKKLCVRWFMQESTFSYEIYSHDEAFRPGKALYQSKVFFHSNDSLKKILKDIMKNLKTIKASF
jgi:hypothetical protein